MDETTIRLIALLGVTAVQITSTIVWLKLMLKPPTGLSRSQVFAYGTYLQAFWVMASIAMGPDSSTMLWLEVASFAFFVLVALATQALSGYLTCRRHLRIVQNM